MPSKSRTSLRKWIRNRENWTTILIPILIVAILVVAGRLIDLHSYLEIVQALVWTFGPWAPVAFGAIYVGAMLLFLPGTPFTVAAALAFGSLWGYVTMLAATTAAAAAGFFVARYVAKETVEKRLSELEGFEKIKGWVEKNHWLAITVVRTMPIFPFAVNNYALGLTDIPFRTYLIASELVFIPMTGVLVFGAEAIYDVTVRGRFSWALVGASAGTGLVVLVLALVGRRVFSPKH